MLFRTGIITGVETGHSLTENARVRGILVDSHLLDLDGPTECRTIYVEADMDNESEWKHLVAWCKGALTLCEQGLATPMYN